MNEQGKKQRFSQRFPGWLFGLAGVSSLTFVFGFYQPATAASDKHVEQFKRLAKEYRTAVQEFETTSRALEETRELSAQRKTELDDISAAESSERGALSDLYEEVKSELKTLIEANVVSVDQGAESVSVSIESSFLIYPHKTFVHAQGAQHLCTIARAIPQATTRPTEVVAHAHGEKPASRIIVKELPTSWALSSALAAEVTQKLQGCGIAGAELRAIGAAHFEGETQKARKSLARLEVLIYPSVSK